MEAETARKIRTTGGDRCSGYSGFASKISLSSSKTGTESLACGTREKSYWQESQVAVEARSGSTFGFYVHKGVVTVLSASFFRIPASSKTNIVTGAATTAPSPTDSKSLTNFRTAGISAANSISQL